MVFKRENKYLVEKWEDIDKLPEEGKEALLTAVSRIEANRAREGKKPCNSYVVVNEDEPYAEAVWELIKDEEEHRAKVKAILEKTKHDPKGSFFNP